MPERSKSQVAGESVVTAALFPFVYIGLFLMNNHLLAGLLLWSAVAAGVFLIAGPVKRAVVQLSANAQRSVILRSSVASLFGLLSVGFVMSAGRGAVILAFLIYTLVSAFLYVINLFRFDAAAEPALGKHSRQ